MIRHSTLMFGIPLLMVFCAASTVRATPFVEIGDAGALPGTAQITTGSGPLTSISGTIGPLSFSDADMYRLHIAVASDFSATTVGTGGTLGDTQLFLFDIAGFGVYGRDDNPGTPRTTLPAGNALGPLVAADYLLLITGFNLDPVSAGGLIFPDTPRSTLFGPSGPGGLSPISGYSLGLAGRGTYTINLTGAEFAAPTAVPVPEPATLLLLGAGLVRLQRRQRR